MCPEPVGPSPFLHAATLIAPSAAAAAPRSNGAEPPAAAAGAAGVGSAPTAFPSWSANEGAFVGADPTPAAPAAAAGGSAPFDRGAAAAALGAINVAACKKGDGPTGSGHIKVTFAPNGSVSS